MTDNKAPPKYLSHQTNNPNVNRSYYFTCPISSQYNLGQKAGKEMYKGQQDWKKHIRTAVGRIITEKGVSAEDAKALQEDAFKQLEEAMKSEKNKELINPEYEEYIKNKPTRSRTIKEDQTLKIKELEEKILELEALNQELTERVGRRDATIEELQKQKQKRPKVKKGEPVKEDEEE